MAQADSRQLEQQVQAGDGADAIPPAGEDRVANMGLTELALAVARAKRLAETGGKENAAAANIARDVASLARQNLLSSSENLLSPREADRAMEKLAPHIARAAKAVHGRHASLRRQTAQDFIASAPAMVWAKIENFEDWYLTKLPPDVRADPSKDWFTAWVRTELGFRYLDAGRGQGSQIKSVSLDEHVVSTAAPKVDEADEEFRLAPDEAQSLRRWDPLDGVILFCLADHWHQVPADIWRGWLDALGMPVDGFPSEAFKAAGHAKKRTILADDLGVSRDVIYQRWLRMKRRFDL